ncbi:SRPBCC domain-containing protein [Streptosporangium sp. 'caverna']|uniref:SRPBCC domain-containing protein n=1 Tax=Streptosporangium sp. 'caverna' TaxID=2202249 RepID=UPI000D7DA8DE|nr:SRPBCC domain-containing protein [Streptosporangium sp. 'caverna']AWS43641.1 polyketide cyclase [Streptosporangium sp. 'caverna']
MNEDHIERDTLIAASLERVWSLVAEPGFWVSEEASIWGGDEAGLAGVVAGEGASMVAKNANLGEVAVRVEKVEPPTYVAYRWSSAFPGAELREDNSTLVEFTLSEEGDKTRLRVVESGFASLSTSAELRDKAIRFNTEGWPQVFEAVRNRAEQAR